MGAQCLCVFIARLNLEGVLQKPLWSRSLVTTHDANCDQRFLELPGVGTGCDVLVWRVKNSFHKHPFKLCLPSKGNINLRCSGRRKNKFLLKSKQGRGGFPAELCSQLSWGRGAAHLLYRQHVQRLMIPGRLLEDKLRILNL